MTKVISNLIEVHVFRIKNKKLEFLLLKRSRNDSYPNIWQMVSGAIKKNESAVNAAIREVKEETGLNANKLYVIPKVNSLYYHKKDKIILIPVFACKVNFNSKVVISNEHSDFKWVSFSQAKKMLTWKQQRESLQIFYYYWNHEKESIKFVEINL